MEEIREEQASWLQSLKEQSWEAELLVSAIGTFASFQLLSVVEWLMFIMIDYLPPSQYFIGYIATYTGMVAVGMLTSMFILHFFLRFYWVGLVGLNSVFREGDSKNSAFSEIYTTRLMSMLPKVEHTINRVDEQCSVIFSIAFCLVAIYAYFAALLGLFMVYYNLSAPYLPFLLQIFPAVFVAAVAIVQTIVSATANIKSLHANQKIQTLYYHVTRFQNLVFLGPFYTSVQQIMMAFWMNFRNKKGLLVLMGGCFFIGLCTSVYFTVNSKALFLLHSDYFNDESRLYSEYYAPNNGTVSFLISPEIDSDVTNAKVTTLFVPVFHYEKRLQHKLCDEIEEADTAFSKGKRDIACLQKYHQVRLNDKPYVPHFRRIKHPLTGQKGLFAYVDLSEANTGENTLTIEKKLEEGDPIEWHIPFYVPK
jgi:hypothetical protein